MCPITDLFSGFECGVSECQTKNDEDDLQIGLVRSRLCISGGSSRLQTADVRQITDAVDRHYNELKSLQAQFTETYRGAGMRREESGTLWLKKPGEDAVGIRFAAGKALPLRDGKTSWFYVPGEFRVQKAPVSKIDDLRSPLRFLL